MRSVHPTALLALALAGCGTSAAAPPPAALDGSPSPIEAGGGAGDANSGHGEGGAGDEDAGAADDGAPPGLDVACAAYLGSSPTSSWVYPDSNGKLHYTPLGPGGDTIMDFSSAGYMGGGVALPTVAVQRKGRPVRGRRHERDSSRDRQCLRAPARERLSGRRAPRAGGVHPGGLSSNQSERRRPARERHRGLEERS